MKDKDVTNLVHFGEIDDESLPITKCVCGAEFQKWNFVIGIYRESDFADECPKCHRKLYFSNRITVYEVLNEARIN